MGNNIIFNKKQNDGKTNICKNNDEQNGFLLKL